MGILAIVLSCIFFSGWLFCAVFEAPIVIPTGQGVVFYYPGTDFQTWAETLAVFIFTLTGVVGLLVVYQNISQPQSGGKGIALAILGLLLIVISVATLVWLTYIKILFYV
ncbi:MAG: hypothetical protein N3F04_03055 [Candidatus Nezhaarchaeota archaeon]|nr:hypothetical protein [Candidatus Nezhaarchaeota archaeon]MCX8141747.1 hypothetical protein [Candidatus Nezhaarchaeota archaeon]